MCARDSRFEYAAWQIPRPPYTRDKLSVGTCMTREPRARIARAMFIQRLCDRVLRPRDEDLGFGLLFLSPARQHWMSYGRVFESGACAGYSGNCKVLLLRLLVRSGSWSCENSLESA